MRSLTILLGVALVVSLSAAPTQAQKITGGKASGTLVSASATTAAFSASGLFNVPADGRFILTQACATAGGVTLEGTVSFGVIAPFGPQPIAGAGGCVSYEPGIALEPGEQLGFVNDTPDTQSLTITGILSNR